MTERLEKLKQKRAELDRKIALATAAERKELKRADDRVKVLVGAMVLESIRQQGRGVDDLLERMSQFLVRPAERLAVLGEDGRGSEPLLRLTGP